MDKYYVYGYFREDGTPYYIGKGCDDRAWCKSHRVEVPPRNRIRILQDGLTNREALDWEGDLISLLGRQHDGTGCLENLKAYGSTYAWTDDHRRAASERARAWHAANPRPKKPRKKKEPKRKAESPGFAHLLVRYDTLL